MTDTVEDFDTNDQLVLIGGMSASGKSASLRNIPNQEKWIYLNCESGKRLPFPNKFNQVKITDPWDVMAYFDQAIEHPDKVDGMIIDSLTFLMDMFESMYVLGSSNTMQGWSNYQQYFKTLMQEKITKFGKPVIIIAHIREDLDEKAMEYKSSVPIKGALKNNGIEAYFSCVVYAKKVPLKELESMDPELCHITEDDEDLGYKHVFQTRPTKKTVGDRIRSPMGLFKRNQTFIDNDAALLLKHLNNFYGIES